MKKRRKIVSWLMLSTILLANSPLVYAQEIQEIVETSQSQAYYEEAVEEARETTVGGDNANTTNASNSDQTTAASTTDGGDAIQQPKITEEGQNAEEAALRSQYGEPVLESGQEQLYKVDETRFVTYIGSQAKTYIDHEGREVPIDLELYSYHADGTHYYLPKESPVDVVLPAKVTETTPIDVISQEDKISLYPLDKTYEHATVEDNAILYNNVDGATDVQYTVQSNGVKEEIVLSKWEEKNRFTYVLEAGNYDVSLETNQVLVRQKGKKEILFVLNAPLMVDAAGETSQDIKLELAEKDGHYHITVVAGKEWLADKARQYPVRIDPTITVPRENILDSVTSSVHGQYQGYAYGYIGYMTVESIGMKRFADVKDIGRSRMYFKVNYDFKQNIPSEAKIDSATLNLYEYTAPGNQGTQFAAYRLTEDFNINTVTWNSSVNLGREIAGENAISEKKVGMHNFDIRDAVNGWVQGLYPNYGLVVAATDEGADGGAFYTTEATASNAGQIGFTPEKAPSITINWSVPDPVDINYAIGDTTINLRTMVKTDKSGKLQFQGVFADGLTSPAAQVGYQLSDPAKNYTGQSTASFSYKYPDTASFISAFEKGTTQYKDKLSNWQTLVPFTEPELNTLYTIDAESQKDGQTSGKKSSDSFIIYKVTQYDTLPKIASYYGVPLKQIAFDNRIQDMLLVKNNTLFIRNPSKNANKPYNPPALTDKVKADVDMLLMGRGLHCEFGFEPINLNTGNFYLERTDVSISDLGGDFAIVRNYNSKAAGINSLFGRGWSFAFNEQLSLDDEGNINYLRTDGSILTFIKEGDTYKAPEGYDLTLTVKEIETKKADFGNGEEDYAVKEYHITDSNQQEKIFNFHGLLTSQTDEKGNKTSLSYNEQAQLTKITSPTGLVYGVTQNDSGYIGAIQLPNGSTLAYDYDEAGNLISYTDAAGAKTRYDYDEQGRMIAWYDANGTKIIENVYDEQHRVIQQTDGTGAVSTLSYSDGQTVTTDANGQVTTYTYDKHYRTTAITYPDGSSVRKAYDDDNRLVSETNELGQTTSYTHDSQGNILTETRFDGAVKTSTYDQNNHLLSVTDFAGQTTSHTYDAKGNLLSTSLADGTSITHTVDEQGRILSTTDALGNTVQLAYDGANLVKVTNAAGGVTTLTYNAHNQVTSITNPRGGVTTMTYDAEGRKLSEKDADGVGTSQTFDPAGQVIAVTEGNGNTSSFTYDAFGRKIAASNGEGGQYSYEYDGVGNLLRLTDAEGRTTSYSYDSRGRLLTETDAAGQTVHYKRDAIGRVLERTNEAGQTTSYTYDEAVNQIASITDALGQVTSYSYDKAGNVTQVTYPIGTSTTSSYDALGRRLSYQDQAGRTVTYTYDALGNKLTESLDERTTSYSYDALGNVTKIIYPDKTSVSYRYDSMGNVLEQTDAKGISTQYDYTAAGRLSSTTNALGQITTMTYDANGNQISLTDAAGNTASTRYTGQNQVGQVTDALGHTTHFSYNQMEQLREEIDALGGKTSYQYNELGYLTQVTNPNGHATQLSYTPTAQIKEVIQADGSSIVNEYDALDRLIKQTQSSGLITEYSYDAANRLIAAKDNQSLNESYTYDAAGNRLTTTNSLGQTTSMTYDSYNQLTKVTYADGSSESYTYDLSGNLATKTDVEGHETSYHYDENGNLQKKVDHLGRETSYSYDQLNRVVTETDPEGHETNYEYDVLGNVASVTDANGHQSTYGYDANERLVLYKDPKGQETVLKYDPLGRLLETVAPTGASQTYTYDAVGNRLSETTGEGNTTSYTYDSLNRLLSLTKPTGGKTSYTYDQTGSLSTETDPSGDVTSYVNDLYGRATSRTLPNQATFSYSYDALGRLEKQTAPQGLSKTYTYDVAGNLIKEVDQSDRATSYIYDVAGRLLVEKNALDLEKTYAYDEMGNLTSITSPSGAKTNLSYTKLDQLKTITSPTGRETELSYDPVGQVTKRVINGKRETTYAYDPNGNLLEEVNPLGQVTKRTYDAGNRLTADTNTAGQTSLYSYDKDNRLIKVSSPTGASSSLTYDGNGNLTSVLSGSKRLSSYTYDQEDQLLTATKGSGDEASTSSYTYDSVGNLTSITNGNGQVTKYSYDQLGNVIEKMNALGDSETYTYDVNNQLAKITKADGQTISYDYNKLDQLLTKKTSTESEGQVLYSYDADGRRVAMSDLTGQTRYAYNEEGELTGVRQGDGSLITYTYDDYGNITKMVYPDGSEVAYSYDELDRLTKVTDRDGKVTTYAYDKAGDMTKIERGDGTTSALTYDAAHHVIEIVHCDKKGKLISSYAYEYDDGNYIAKETITQDGETLVQTYTYDSLGQIVKMTVSSKDGKELSQFSYTYDHAGNKLTSTETVDGKESKTEFSYDVENRLLEMKSGDKTLTYTYDKNGNRTSSGAGDAKLDYIYDTENRLLAVKDKEGLLFAALYDGDDNRVFTASRTQATNTYQLFKRKPGDKKRKSPYTAPDGEANSLFWYGFTQNVVQFFSSFTTSEGYDWIETFDTVSTAYHQKVAKDRATEEGLVVNPPSEDNLPGEDEVLYRSQVQDVLIPYTTKEDTYNYYETRNYVNDVNQQHTQVLQTYDDQLQKRETYVYGNGRATYTNESTGDSYHYLTSQSGSVTGLTQNGNSVASSSYNLYGATKQTTDTTGNPFAYNGEARDITGLDYLRARYYDSQAGTFLTADSYPGSQTDPLSQNLYAYVQNNPANYTDPSGHIWKALTNAYNTAKKAVSKAYNAAKKVVVDTYNTVKKAVVNTYNTIRSAVGHAVNWVGQKVNQAVNWAGNAVRQTTNWIGQQFTSQRGYNNSTRNYVTYQQSEAQRQAIAQQQYQQRVNQEYITATGIKGQPKTREAQNLIKNWGPALREMYTHVCNPQTAKGKDSCQNKLPSKSELEELIKKANQGDAQALSRLISGFDAKTGVGSYIRTPEEIAASNKRIWDNLGRDLKNFAGEVLPIYDTIRLITGKDPVTGEKTSRWTAAAWIGAELIPGNDLFKGGKLLGDVGDFAKVADKIDDVGDVGDVVKNSSNTQDWWKNIQRGNAFNKTVQEAELYPFYEVHLANGKRLDSYDLAAGEIISRKATDLDKIQESTFRGYLREFEQKYSVGTEIRSQKYKEQLYGKTLQGSYILEVPASNAKLPNIDYYKQIASEYDVTLRFTEE
ncbi:DNRLRE domain-containing protein [Streptococcus suis]|uniref:DNRLRE domain-containing protein n=7 Tax=Streptococcus suis TaxID=1307 RepID=UPI003BA2BD74